VKDVGDKMHSRGSVGVVVGEGKTEFQDRVGIIALVNEEYGVPNGWIADQGYDVHAKGAVGLI